METGLGAEKTGCFTRADVFAVRLANVERAFSQKTTFSQEAWSALALGVKCQYVMMLGSPKKRQSSSSNKRSISSFPESKKPKGLTATSVAKRGLKKSLKTLPGAHDHQPGRWFQHLQVGRGFSYSIIG